MYSKKFDHFVAVLGRQMAEMRYGDGSTRTNSSQQLFLLTQAAYNLTRMRTLAAKAA